MKADAHTLDVAGAIGRHPAKDFFRSLLDQFELAGLQAGIGEHDFAMADRMIRLRFAGDALADALLPALAHLRAPANGAPDLTVCLWDSASTGRPKVRPAWTRDAYSAQGLVSGYNRDGFQTSYQFGSGALSMMDTAHDRAVFWVPDAHRVPAFERAAPMRTLLHGWMKTRGRQFVHAAAVGHEAAGALLAGPGGSGKSTTAVACLNAGLRFAADDFCLVAGGPEPRIFSLYATAKLHAPGPALDVEPQADRDSGKHLLVLGGKYAARVTPSMPLNVILLPVVTGRARTTVEPADAAEALRAMAPSTIFQLPGAGPDDFAALTALARSVPAYHLSLGTDFAKIPGVVAGVLERHR